MQIPAAMATSGISSLDDVLSGIFWGDNVVFREVASSNNATAFLRAFAHAGCYDRIGVVRLTEEPVPAATTASRQITITAADVDQAVAEALALGREIGPGGLIVFEDLTALVERHGEDGARRFFLRVCPTLLRIGAVACWTLGPRVSDALAAAILAITQIVIHVGADEIVIAKAEARPLNVVGTRLAYDVGADGIPEVEVVSNAARLGAAITAVRMQRGLSQSHMGRLAGVSPSAISQAERGLRGLSVSTLMRLAAALGVSLDELVVGQSEPGYRIRGRTAPHRGGASRVALVDGGQATYRMYEFRLDPGAHGTPPSHPGGTELVLLGQGLLMVTMTDGTTPVIREGEVLVASGAGVADWRNLDEDQAMGFWLAV
jgi:transcriptional regulator with XRE-family HTH domain